MPLYKHSSFPYIIIFYCTAVIVRACKRLFRRIPGFPQEYEKMTIHFIWMSFNSWNHIPFFCSDVKSRKDICSGCCIGIQLQLLNNVITSRPKWPAETICTAPMVLLICEHLGNVYNVVFVFYDPLRVLFLNPTWLGGIKASSDHWLQYICGTPNGNTPCHWIQKTSHMDNCINLLLVSLLKFWYCSMYLYHGISWILFLNLIHQLM